VMIATSGRCTLLDVK